MKVSSTEVQNNFGKYLMLAAREDIIITKNGREIARLSADFDREACLRFPSEVIHEEAAAYSYGGRKSLL